MFKKIIFIIFLFLSLISCGKKEKAAVVNNADIFRQNPTDQKLPNDLVWLTNERDPVFASSDTKRGGTFRSYITDFPNTFRTVGPDANTSFRDFISNNQLSLLSMHPNTENIIPCLATHWAFGSDKKTMYFKLNKNAKWSDNVSVTAEDFAYTVFFGRSKEIVAPFANDYYNKYIDKVDIYDEHTISITAKEPLPELHFYLNLSPSPRHFYGKLADDFVQKYNWAIVPNTGPYQISDFKKGKYVTFERKKDWWASDFKYFKNRFNVDKVIFTVYKNLTFVWEYFKKGRIDARTVLYPDEWYEKTKDQIFSNGYAEKIWFFTDTTQSSRGIFLNQDYELFKDINNRLAFMHAMNIEKVIEKIHRNDLYRLDHDFVGYGKYTNKNIKARTFDIAKVEYYMKKSGWYRGSDGIWTKEGKKFSVEITYSLDNDTPDLVLIKEEAEKCGIEIKLDKLDYTSRYKKIMEKKHQAAWGAFSTGARPEYWQFYHSDNAHKPQTNNTTNTDDKELDKLIDKYKFSIDINERIALSQLIQQKLFNIAVFVPTYMRPYVRMVYWRWWRLPEIQGTKDSNMYFEIDESLFDPFNSSIGGMFWYDKDIHKETLDAIKKGIKFPEATIIDETYKPGFLKNK